MITDPSRRRDVNITNPILRTLCPILLLVASAASHAEPREPFVIAIEPGKSIEEATATEALTVYGDPAVPLVRNVTSPTLTAYLPDTADATGAAVIVAPGGAYVMLAIEHEGTDAARWLAERGIAAFVLRYRVAPMPETDEGFKAMRDRQMREPELLGPIIEAQAPLSIADGRAAVKLLRTRAAEWGVDPDRIGILGFSAGGGVALGAATQYEAGERPYFAALIYGALAVETIPDDAPPLFVLAAADDPAVPAENSNRLFSRWRAAGHSAELHIYSRGGHGFGMLPQGLPTDRWIDAFYAWLVAERIVVGTT
jgi:acetyl esterase/lipase